MLLTRVYRPKDSTPNVKEIEAYRDRIQDLLKDGYAVQAIVRKLGWGNDIPLRSWLRLNPELDTLRARNGKIAQKRITIWNNG